MATPTSRPNRLAAGVVLTACALAFSLLAACGGKSEVDLTASGKELMTGVEWFRASKGTIDLPAGCWIDPANMKPRNTGVGTNCASDWGAQDMIGNLEGGNFEPFGIDKIGFRQSDHAMT